ncbi:MAG: hypothetical protein IJ115_01290 [Erysipelotrichaceae bacterium]|nr:hypothetical protein [Erysipelotrichaceae bacterium]
MAERSTVLGEYGTIQKEKKQAALRRKFLIIGLVVLFVALVGGGWYYYYNNSTLSWNDEQWYEHAVIVLDDNKKEINYWSISANAFVEDEDYDYDNSCLEYFYFYISKESGSISINLNNNCYDGHRVDYELGQNYDYSTDGSIHSLYYNNEYSYVSKIRPDFISEWEKDFTLDNIYLPDPDDIEITYSYKESHSDDIMFTTDMSSLPQNMQDAIYTSMFGKDYDVSQIIITEVLLSVEIENDRVESYSITVNGKDVNTGKVSYSRDYYLSYDEAYVYVSDSGEVVTDWSSTKAVQEMLPLNSRLEGDNNDGNNGL